MLEARSIRPMDPAVERFKRSFSVLLAGVVIDAKELLAQQLTLTKLELQRELAKAKTAAIALGIGLAIIAMGATLLLLMLVQILAVYTQIPLWGCYGIVGGMLALFGALLIASGKSKAEEVRLVPSSRIEMRKETAP